MGFLEAFKTLPLDPLHLTHDAIKQGVPVLVILLCWRTTVTSSCTERQRDFADVIKLKGGFSGLSDGPNFIWRVLIRWRPEGQIEESVRTKAAIRKEGRGCAAGFEGGRGHGPSSARGL